MEEFTRNDLLIKEDITPEEIYNTQGNGRYIKNLGVFYSDILFLSKYSQRDKNTNVIYIGDYSHISFLLELFPYIFVHCYNKDNIDVDMSSGRIVLYQRDIDDREIKRWKSLTEEENVLLIVYNYEIEKEKNIVLSIRPFAFSIDFDIVDSKFKYLDGEIHIIPFSDPNSIKNKLFGNNINNKIWDMESYQNSCNYINMHKRTDKSFLNIIYMNDKPYTDLLTNDLDSSILIYTLFYYLYKYKEMVNIKRKHVEDKILNLEERIRTNVQHEYIEYEKKEEDIMFKNNIYLLKDVINKSEILDCIAINNIKDSDRKTLYKLSTDEKFRHIIEYFPIGKSKKYNQDEFLVAVKNKNSMISYIQKLKEENIFINDKSDNYEILDNCNVKKFIKYKSKTDFHNRIFNLMRLNNKLNNKKDKDTITRFFDKCIEILQ